MENIKTLAFPGREKIPSLSLPGMENILSVFLPRDRKIALPGME